MANYRVCFDIAGETPSNAIIHLIGIIEDPSMRDREFDWLVVDQDTGEEHKVRCSLADLDREARASVEKFLRE